MKNKYSLLLAVVLLLYLSSCSVHTNFVRPDQRGGRGVDDGSQIFSDASQDGVFTNITPKIIDDNSSQIQNWKPQIRTNKRVLCSTFIPPEIPESPKVDLNKLRTIPSGDHDAVKNLLIDNIQAMNTHAKQVEERLKEAYRKHRTTCTIREVVSGREK